MTASRSIAEEVPEPPHLPASEQSDAMTARARIWMVGLAFALTLLAASAPYLYGYLIRPTASRFWAVPMVNYYDANQYLALTRQAAAGHSVLSDPFTAEPHLPRLFLPEVQAEGAVCRALGVSPFAAFHGSRVFCGALLLSAGWWLATLVFPDWRRRWLFLPLMCFSAGAGWLVQLFGAFLNNGDVWQPEANTFHTLSNLPHLSLSAALLTGLFASLLSITRSAHPADGSSFKSRTPSLAMLLFIPTCAALLGWTHPFDLLTYGGTALVYGGLVAVIDRRALRPLLIHLASVGVGALPSAIYLGWVVATDPFYRALANDPSTVQSVTYYAVAHGILMVPAVLFAWLGKNRRDLLLPLCWVLFSFLVQLLPIRLGGKLPRLLGGVHIPLALLAVAGIEAVSAWIGARQKSPLIQQRVYLWLGTSLVVLAGTGAWGVVERQCRWYAPRDRDFYLSPAVTGLYSRLRAAGSTNQPELVLGGPYTGGWTPVLADVKVYCGHWQMTLDEPRKRAEQQWFFTSSASPSEKAAWLRDAGIRWVVWYPWEWGDQGKTPAGIPGLKLNYFSSEISLYRFDPHATRSYNIPVSKPGTPRATPGVEHGERTDQ